MKPKKTLFLELAKPDKKGRSRKVYPKEFKGKYKSLAYRNGNPWARSIKEYVVCIHKEKGKTEYIKTTGFKDHSFNQNINLSIKNKVLSKPCVVLHTKSNLECDHKDGFKKINILPKNQTKDLFQPMHKTVNDTKREHCKKCRQTHIRFDAKKLGYKRSQWKGTNKYEETCEGCYWYDPFLFNKKSSM